MKKIYQKKFLVVFMLLLSAVYIEVQATNIIFVGRGSQTDTSVYSSDADIIDSLVSWGFEITWVPNDTFKAATFNPVIYEGKDGIFFNETCDSKALIRFGEATDNYALPAIVLEGYAIATGSDRWAWISDNAASLFQTASSAGTEDDQKIIIKDNKHYITEIFSANDEIRWSKIEGTNAANDMLGCRPVSIKEDKVKFDERLAIMKSHELQSNFWNMVVIDEMGANKNKLFYWGVSDIGMSGENMDAHYATPEFYTIIRRACEWTFDAIPVEPQGINTNLNRLNFELSVFPNPASDNLTIRFVATKSQNVTATILDLTGKQIAVLSKQSVSGNNFFFHDVSKYNSGLYIVKLQIGNQVQYQKFTIK